MPEDALPFPAHRAVIAVIHLPPGAGSPAADPGASPDCDAELERVAREARQLAAIGCHALVVENFGDAPFLKDRVEPHTIARLALAALTARREAQLPVGVNVLRNDALAAIGCAAASGATFVRVNVHTGTMATDQGLIEGRAGETLRYRRALGARVAVLADVHVKHAVPLPGMDLLRTAADTLERGLADALIVSGSATGAPADRRDLARLRKAFPSARLLVGSGVTAPALAGWLALANGVIVSSTLRAGGRAGAPLDERRLAGFARAIARARG